MRAKSIPTARRHGDRFSRTVDDEIRLGIVWTDYRHRLSPYLLPRPDDTAEDADAAIRRARAHDLDMDTIATGTPGTAPSWPHWEGLR